MGLNFEPLDFANDDVKGVASRLFSFDIQKELKKKHQHLKINSGIIAMQPTDRYQMQFDESRKNYKKLSSIQFREHGDHDLESDEDDQDQFKNDLVGSHRNEDENVNFDIIPKEVKKGMSHVKPVEFNFDKRSIIDLLQDQLAEYETMIFDYE